MTKKQNKPKVKDDPKVAQPSTADRLRDIYAAMEEFNRRLTAVETDVGVVGPAGPAGARGAQGERGPKGGFSFGS